MLCPRDGHEMVRTEFGGVAIDACPACGGVWFDAFELAKFDDAVEHHGEELIMWLEQLVAGTPAVDLSERLPSPVDPEVLMMRRFADPEGTIELDKCPVSGGIWLDAGELARLRARFPDEATRREATRIVIDRVMRCPEFRADRAAEAAGLSGVTRVARLLSWITPWREAA